LVRADNADRSEAGPPVAGYHSIGADYTAFSQQGKGIAEGKRNVAHWVLRGAYVFPGRR